ncbi:SigE family RNA polymerase sigma factor [Thalassiella azotivora]
MDDEFVAFADGTRAHLMHTAWLLTGDRHTAEDLVQEALVRTYVRWSRVRRGEELAYTRRILTNLSVDGWRRRRREHLPGDVPEAAASSGGVPTVDARDEVVRALASLTPRERSVVVLRYYADLTEQQVAADLGVSVGTVKSTASRALARLRQDGSTAGATGPDQHERARRTR